MHILKFLFKLRALVMLFCLLLVGYVGLTQVQSGSTNGGRNGQCPANKLVAGELPEGFNALFAGSGECLLCHNDMTDAQGKSIGILDDWRSTMMGNSAKDPFWRAKVSHETLVNPENAQALEDVCTRCHAPLGNFNVHYLGQQNYSISEMEADALALDGVSCTLCHQAKEEGFGSYSGNLTLGDEKMIWGPYTEPFPNPMINHTGYTPVFGNHIKDSRLCGSCHTLITQSVDENGDPTGGEFVEQSVYHEWLNSSYSSEGTECQVCHVPEISDMVKVSLMPPWLDSRTPFGLHHFVGANVFMQSILKDNIETLGVTADADHFDSTLSLTSYLLQEAASQMSIEGLNRSDDTLSMEVQIMNLAGHKLPSGFPSRRMHVEILLTSETGDTLFHSGALGENNELIDIDHPYEPHHESITSEDQVQIYEMVMGNSEGNVTTVLERATEHLKDNRLPPLGFTTAHYSYDTVEIAGLAKYDPDFNTHNGNEGTGIDVLHVKAALNGNSGIVNVTARLKYQTVAPSWLSELFEFSSPEIDLWKTLYEQAETEPILMDEVSTVSLPTSLQEPASGELVIYPNPSKGNVSIVGHEGKLSKVELFKPSGEKVREFLISGSQTTTLNIDAGRGLYLLNLVFEDDRSYCRRIIVH